jgi:hypothetical protein
MKIVVGKVVATGVPVSSVPAGSIVKFAEKYYMVVKPGMLKSRSGSEVLAVGLHKDFEFLAVETTLVTVVQAELRVSE